MPRGSNAPKSGQQGFQKTPPKAKEPKNNALTQLRTVDSTRKETANLNNSTQLSNVESSFKKVEGRKNPPSKNVLGKKRQKLENQIDHLADIKESMEQYSFHYKRSAVKDLMAHQKLANVLRDLQTNNYFSLYSSEDTDILLKEVLSKESPSAGGELLTSFASDKENIVYHLENNGYIFTQQSLRDKAEEIAMSETPEEAEKYLKEMSEKLPESSDVLKEFQEDYNLQSGDTYSEMKTFGHFSD